MSPWDFISFVVTISSYLEKSIHKKKAWEWKKFPLKNSLLPTKKSKTTAKNFLGILNHDKVEILEALELKVAPL